MSIDDLAERYDGTDLLTLLALSGWTIRRSPSTGTALRAVRDGVQVSARSSSLPEAICSLFIRAMRAGSASARSTASASTGADGRDAAAERPRRSIG
jgi:hypothetical protein